MKKLILFSISFSLIFSSCFKKIDNWYTETSEYDGRYVVSATCEEYSSDDVPLSDGMELWIFNTSDNLANEIWIDHFSIAGFPMKAKLNVTGDAANFKTAGDVNLYHDSEVIYILVDGNPVAYGPPDPGDATAAGELLDAVHLYTRVSVDTGKIINGGATTPGGNVSDSVFLKLTLYHNAFQYISYETDPADWANPSVPEYDWRIKDGSLTNADGWEEHWTISGYRYTGFPEDIGHKPPIIED
jgi:hypothetical protein